MKKLFFMAMGFALLLTSCSKDDSISDENSLRSELGIDD